MNFAVASILLIVGCTTVARAAVADVADVADDADDADDADAPAPRASLRAPITDRCELVVAFGAESESCWSHACKAKQPVAIGCDLSAMRQVSDVSISPDRKWAAVVSVGEGHPMLEVIELERLLAKREFAAMTTINPFPGTIHVQGWSDSALLVTSDVPLPEMPIADASIYDRIGNGHETYAVDLSSWKIEAAPLTTAAPR